MLPAEIKEVQSGNPSLHDCFFALIGCIECDQSLAAPASLPLVQIVLGISLGFLLPQGKFHLDTELFLALVIGPLLFREAEESNITSILKHWRIICI